MFDGLPNVKKGCAKLSILAIRNQITFTNIRKKYVKKITKRQKSLQIATRIAICHPYSYITHHSVLSFISKTTASIQSAVSR